MPYDPEELLKRLRRELRKQEDEASRPDEADNPEPASFRENNRVKPRGRKVTLLDFMGTAKPKPRRKSLDSGRPRVTPSVQAGEPRKTGVTVERSEPPRPTVIESRGSTETRTETPAATVSSTHSQGAEARKNEEAHSTPIDVKLPTPEGYKGRPEGLREAYLNDRILGIYADSARGYLLEIEYDGRLSKAVALIYDDSREIVVRVLDRTGHRPYFLTNLSPDEIAARNKGVESHEAFIGYDIVTKFDPISRRQVKMTKIIVKDPLAVRSLRERFKGEDEGAWEADIKYHLNYIYDLGLVPGMPYSVGSTWAPLDWKVDEDTQNKIIEMLGSEYEGMKDRLVRWLPIFEQPPPLPCIAALDIEVHTPSAGKVPDPSRADLPVISAAVAKNKGKSKVYILYRPEASFSGEGFPEGVEVEIFDSERAMLLQLALDLSECPILATFNGDNFDLPYLRNRMLRLGVPEWAIPFRSRRDYMTVTWGVHIDLYRLFDIRALQVYAFGNKYREKNLDAIAEALLGERKVEMPDTVSNVPLDLLVRYNFRDARLTLDLLRSDNYLVWNLIVLLMRISKMGIEDVTRTQVSGWIKSLMYWEHRRRGYLIPRREDIRRLGSVARSKAIIKDKKYQGAVVLTPPQGIFFDIVVLDFASLYPSIMKNWNLSYETVNNPHCNGKKVRVPEVEHEVCMSIKGITSEIVGLLRDFRVRVYKKKSKSRELSEAERKWYDTVQSAMKVYINASYGVFGNDSFSLFSLAVAESVTAIGRNVLLDTLREASRRGLHIVYGDTDSLFVWAPESDKLEDLTRYVREKHGLELEVDKRLKLALFSGLKKNYIGVVDENNIIIKGMVGKKSNTPEFIKKAFAEAVSIIAKLERPEDVSRVLEALRDHVKEIHRKLKQREYTLDELAFRVTLTKDVREYRKNTPQHVKAALQLMKYGVNVQRGDIIAFIKTRDSLGVRPVRLAKMTEIDVNKYMEYVRTTFEQMLMAFGVAWEEISGVRSLFSSLGGA